MTPAEIAIVAFAALGAGFANALAGGGTLLSFPALMAVGVPPVAANITSTVALCPGYFGAVLGQRRDLDGQWRRVWVVLPAAAAGGVVGGLLLLGTGERAFRSLVPFLILLASMLLAVQDRVRVWLVRRGGMGAEVRLKPDTTPARGTTAGGRAALPVAAAAVYGGYFGAGLSVIVLAVLGLLVDDTLTRLNALKQAVALAVNLAAVGLFLFSGLIVWEAVAVMAVGALAGGALGGRLASVVHPRTLRFSVVVIGFAVAVLYFVG
jgi:hypothetical protein